MDGARSAARTIQNNLLDSSKQEAIDILLVGSTLNSELADRARILLPSNILHGMTRTVTTVYDLNSLFNTIFTRGFHMFFVCFILAPTPVLRELCKRSNEYTSPQEIRVGVATYNVNGGKHFRSVVYKDLSLSDWLLDAHKIPRSGCKSAVLFPYPCDIFLIILIFHNICHISKKSQKLLFLLHYLFSTG